MYDIILIEGTNRLFILNKCPNIH